MRFITPPFFPLFFSLFPFFFLLFRKHGRADENAVEDHADDEKNYCADEDQIGKGEAGKGPFKGLEAEKQGKKDPEKDENFKTPYCPDKKTLQFFHPLLGIIGRGGGWCQEFLHKEES